MEVTKLGHCCLLIEIRGIRILTDPGNYTTLQETVKGLDLVVISHEHPDHLHLDSLKKVLENNPEAKVICNGSVGKILEKHSIPYQKVSSGEVYRIGDVKISGHGTEHALIYREYEQVENTGYLLDDRLFYPGDAFHDPQVPIEILAFPVTAPWCKISEAMDYVLAIKPQIAFAVHDGNLVRHGITNRLPNIFLPKAGIKFVALEINKPERF